jgi:hypothetical protein
MEVELDFLKKENYRLFHENKSLKTEKSFLIEQIKFMQSLIKSNNLPKCSDDIEKNITSESNSPQIYMNGAKQRKPFGKLFSVFVICVLSVAYVSFDGSNLSDNKIEFNSGSMSLNDTGSSRMFGDYYIYMFYAIKALMIICIVGLSFYVYNWLFSLCEKKTRKNDKLL